MESKSIELNCVNTDTLEINLKSKNSYVNESKSELEQAALDLETIMNYLNITDNDKNVTVREIDNRIRVAKEFFGNAIKAMENKKKEISKK